MHAAGTIQYVPTCSLGGRNVTTSPSPLLQHTQQLPNHLFTHRRFSLSLLLCLLQLQTREHDPSHSRFRHVCRDPLPSGKPRAEPRPCQLIPRPCHDGTANAQARASEYRQHRSGRAIAGLCTSGHGRKRAEREPCVQELSRQA